MSLRHLVQTGVEAVSALASRVARNADSALSSGLHTEVPLLTRSIKSLPILAVLGALTDLIQGNKKNGQNVLELGRSFGNEGANIDAIVDNLRA